MISEEISHCSQTSTIFRGSSLGTSALLYYLKFVGRVYLQQTLCTIVENIVIKKLPCGLKKDGESEDQWQIKFNNLVNYIQLISSAILNSAPYFPVQLQQVFYVLRKKVLEKFGKEASINAVNGFLFLRFFVPAIKSPQDCGIIENIEIADNEIKLLGILANFIQKMANNLPFRENDELFPLNKYMEESKKSMEEFMEAVSKEVHESDIVVDEQPSPLLQVNIAEDAACIYSYLQNGCEDFIDRNRNMPIVQQFVSVINLVKENIVEYEDAKGNVHSDS